MRELNFVGPGQLEWREVAAPKIDAPDQALVRPLAVATCDLDTLLLRGEALMFGGGFPLGHESVGVVVEVGEHVTAFKPGDRVVPSFQISCGTCDRCRRGLTGNCERVRGTPMYGIGARGGNFGGALSDLMKVHTPTRCWSRCPTVSPLPTSRALRTIFPTRGGPSRRCFVTIPARRC